MKCNHSTFGEKPQWMATSLRELWVKRGLTEAERETCGWRRGNGDYRSQVGTTVQPPHCHSTIMVAVKMTTPFQSSQLLSSCCPCHQGCGGHGYCHIFFVCSFLTFLSLRSLSTVSSSFHLLLLFPTLSRSLLTQSSLHFMGI